MRENAARLLVDFYNIMNQNSYIRKGSNPPDLIRSLPIWSGVSRFDV